MENKTNHNLKSKKKKPSQFVGGIILAVFVVFLIFTLVFAIGIYGFNWENNFVKKITRIFPYPVSLVNYKFIRFSDYFDDVDTLTYYYDQLSQSQDNTVPKPSDEDLKKLAISRMVRNEFTQQLAKNYDIKITKMDLDQEVEKVISQSGSKEEVEKALKEFYNWTIDDLRENVLVYFLLRARMQDKLSFDDSLKKNQEAKSKTTEVLAEVLKGEESFENLAKKYSEDDLAEQGGYLGFFRLGDMIEAFEKAALALEVNETSGLVRTKYGYHIIKLLSKKGEGEDIQLEASHILIRIQDIDEYINQNIKDARIYIFAQGIKWNKKVGEAVMPGFQDTGSENNS